MFLFYKYENILFTKDLLRDAPMISQLSLEHDFSSKFWRPKKFDVRYYGNFLDKYSSKTNRGVVCK